MSQINRLTLIVFLLVSWSIVTFGGAPDKAGTAAAPELRIPLGARYLAMGGSEIAAVTGLESIYWNPAGVDFAPADANAMFSYRKYIADMNIDYVALSGRFGDFGSLGIAFRYFNIGDINVTTLDQPDGTGEILSPNYFVVGLTYSNRLTDRVSIGVNFNIINESWGRVSATGFGIDAGVQYRNLMDVKGLALGVVIKNLGGSLQYDGNANYVQAEETGSDRGPTWYKIASQSDPLPSEMALGVSYTHQIDGLNNLTVAGTYTNNNYTYDDYKVGLEYSYNNTFYLRGGYLYSPETTDAAPNIFGDYTVGAGLNFMEFTNINLSADYAYIPVKYFDSNHVFTIRLGF